MQDLHNQAAKDGAPDYVMIEDGNFLKNATLAKRETRFLSKVNENPDHQVSVTWDDASLDEGPNLSARFKVHCSCDYPWNWDYVNADGSIGVRHIRGVNKHILVQTLQAAQPVVVDDEPFLIAKVHLTRVTHEWWVFHYSSDLADEVANTRNHWGNQTWPWMVAVKKTNGWRTQVVEKTKEQAIAGALRRLENERARGNGVEIFDIEATIGIEAPTATISSSVRRLIDDAKGLKPKATPHEIQTVLQAANKGLIQLKLLEVLQKDLQRRFDESFDLT